MARPPFYMLRWPARIALAAALLAIVSCLVDVLATPLQLAGWMSTAPDYLGGVSELDASIIRWSFVLAFAFWFSRAHHDHAVLARSGDWQPVLVWFCVPFMNLVLPVQRARVIWRRVVDEDDVRLPTAAWLLYILSGASGVVVAVLLAEPLSISMACPLAARCW